MRRKFTVVLLTSTVVPREITDLTTLINLQDHSPLANPVDLVASRDPRMFRDPKVSVDPRALETSAVSTDPNMFVDPRDPEMFALPERLAPLEKPDNPKVSVDLNALPALREPTDLMLSVDPRDPEMSALLERLAPLEKPDNPSPSSVPADPSARSTSVLCANPVTLAKSHLDALTTSTIRPTTEGHAAKLD